MLEDGVVVQGREGIKGRKNWDNCNSTINRIYYKRRKLNMRTVMLSNWMELFNMLIVKNSEKIFKGQIIRKNL